MISTAIRQDDDGPIGRDGHRVFMIARNHHPLNSYKSVRTIEFKKFFEDFCRDFSAMASSDESPGRISVEGCEIILPATTAIPLGFIASEFITNAAKYGKGRIAVRLEVDPKHGYALSVANGGAALPEGFDPNARQHHAKSRDSSKFNAVSKNPSA